MQHIKINMVFYPIMHCHIISRVRHDCDCHHCVALIGLLLIAYSQGAIVVAILVATCLNLWHLLSQKCTVT